MPQEYLTEIFYPSRFYDFMSPTLLAYLAALHGFPPPPTGQGFTYGELGCGGAATINALAAANPNAQFWGIDINPEHIAYARRVAEQGGIKNIQFIESDFNTLDLDALPRFDYICLHGIYSWVGPQTRASITRIIQQKLKPNGLAMVSYNALPGSAAIQPLRDMMLTYTESSSDNARARVEQGVAYLKYLVEHKSRYFEDNPIAKEAVENLFLRDRDYLAHEFFNAYWTPFYFIEVAQDMSRAGLSFVGTLPVLSNYLEMTIPQPFQEFFQTAPDRILLERHKAFVRNERFRRDVYVKTEQNFLPEEQRNQWFMDMVFGSEYETVQSKTSISNGPERVQLDYSGDPCRWILESLHAGAQTPRQLLENEPRLQNIAAADAVYAIQMLVLGSEFRPFAHPAAAPPLPPAPATRLRMPLAFNRYLLRHCQQANEGIIYLASTVTGDGVPVSLLDAVMLRELLDNPDPAVVPEKVWESMNAAGQSLSVENKEELSRDMQIALLGDHLHQLLGGKMGKWIELGLVEAVE